ncbi:MAG: energy-coupling factor transporter transmembrane protein EcfT [Pirellulales bacterium]|nr:energy-coupling factor transporter transmembrane protein EcfT [Pirellulales bacterium]
MHQPTASTCFHRLPTTPKLLCVLLFVLLVVALPGEWLALGKRLPISLAHVAAFALAAACLAWAIVAWRPLWLRLLLFAAGWGCCLLGMLLWTPAAGRSHLWELGAKGMLSFLALYLLAATTPPAALAAALHRLGLPRPLASIVFSVERFRHVLRQEAERMQRAQKARTFSQSGRARRTAAAAALVGMLLVRATRRAQRVYAAMLARGYQEIPQAADPQAG